MTGYMNRLSIQLCCPISKGYAYVAYVSLAGPDFDVYPHTLGIAGFISGLNDRLSDTLLFLLRCCKSDAYRTMQGK
jgi:hypothetical protein